MPVSLFDLEITLRAASALRNAPRPIGCVELFLALVDRYVPQVGEPTREDDIAPVHDWERDRRRPPFLSG